MNQSPTYKLREDAILDELKQELATHGPDVLVDAISEFFLGGRMDLYKRVQTKVGAQRRVSAARKRKADLIEKQQQTEQPLTAAIEQGAIV